MSCNIKGLYPMNDIGDDIYIELGKHLTNTTDDAKVGLTYSKIYVEDMSLNGIFQVSDEPNEQTNDRMTTSIYPMSERESMNTVVLHNGEDETTNIPAPNTLPEDPSANILHTIKSMIFGPNETPEKEAHKKVEDNDNTAELNNNKVDVEIEPDVKSNNVLVQFCSCYLSLNCCMGQK